MLSLNGVEFTDAELDVMFRALDSFGSLSVMVSGQIVLHGPGDKEYHEGNAAACSSALKKLLKVRLGTPPSWDSARDQEAECVECEHPYFRHFDSYDEMRPVGCKYCSCLMPITIDMHHE